MRLELYICRLHEFPVFWWPSGVPTVVVSGIFSNLLGDQPKHPAVQQFVDNMLQMMEEQGARPQDFATAVFAGIAKGDYWLFPQPEYIDEALRVRAATIAQRNQPGMF